MTTPPESKLAMRGGTHVTIAVSGLDRSVAVYRRVPGCQEIDDVELDLKALAQVLGRHAKARCWPGQIAGIGVDLDLGPLRAQYSAHLGLGMRLLGFDVDDAPATYDRLVGLGLKQLSEAGVVHGLKLL